MGGAGFAEEANQHADVVIHRNRVAPRWWTYPAGAITDRDIELAAPTDDLVQQGWQTWFDGGDLVCFGAGSA